MPYAVRRQLLFALASVAGVVAAADGQVARAVVASTTTRTPVAGLVVVLVDSAGQAVGTTLTDRTGSAELRAFVAGRYRLRLERVGYPDAVSPVLSLADSGAVTHRFELDPTRTPQRLRPVRVEAADRCQRRPQDGAVAADIWNEARKALLAAALAQSSGSLVFRVRRSSRVLHPINLAPEKDEHWEKETESDVPFRSESVDLLTARGFVWIHPDGSADYHGPDAATLLSDAFLDSHCLRAQATNDGHRGQVGLAVEPVRGRTVPDISGTLWLDEQTAKLRTFEYRYVGLRLGVSLEHVGGRIEFDQTPDGRWIVRRWYIRSPIRVRQGDGPRAGEIVLSGIQEVGGEVRAVREAGSLGVRLGAIEGVVFDSIRRRPLEGARVNLAGTRLETMTDARGAFRIDSVPPGAYDAVVSHARVDSLLLPALKARVTVDAGGVRQARFGGLDWSSVASTHCAGASRTDTSGVALGVVRDTSGRPMSGVPVTAAWSQSAPGRGQLVLSDMVAETLTDAAGRFAFCVLPVRRTVALHSGISRRARVVRLDTVPQRVDLVLLARDDHGMARLHDVAPSVRRTVVAIDSAGEPIAGADVQLLRTGFRAQTNEAGVARIDGPIGSTDLVRLRRLGFAPRVAPVTFADGDSLDLRVVLEPIPTVIDGVVVRSDRPVAGKHAGFAERRRAAFASSSRYVTRADIERRNPTRLADMIATIPGFRVDAYGRVTTARGATSLLLPCPVQVYVDGAAYNDQSMLALLQPWDVEAIEAYHASEIPSEYNRTGTACGVILIWTR